MFVNGIKVPSRVIFNIVEIVIKDTNDLLLYDIWCVASESRIQMEGDIPNRLEEYKLLTNEADMACGWVPRIFWSSSTISNI